MEFAHIAHVCDAPLVPDGREDLNALAECSESLTSDFFSIQFSARIIEIVRTSVVRLISAYGYCVILMFYVCRYRAAFRSDARASAVIAFSRNKEEKKVLPSHSYRD